MFVCLPRPSVSSAARSETKEETLVDALVRWAINTTQVNRTAHVVFVTNRTSAARQNSLFSLLARLTDRATTDIYTEDKLKECACVPDPLVCTLFC
jgi:hypothetical protein